MANAPSARPWPTCVRSFDVGSAMLCHQAQMPGYAVFCVRVSSSMITMPKQCRSTRPCRISSPHQPEQVCSMPSTAAFAWPGSGQTDPVVTDIPWCCMQAPLLMMSSSCRQRATPPSARGPSGACARPGPRAGRRAGPPPRSVHVCRHPHPLHQNPSARTLGPSALTSAPPPAPPPACCFWQPTTAHAS